MIQYKNISIINHIHILDCEPYVFSFAQRIACHIQIFALSGWLAVPLPVEYYELTRGLQWSIPYFNLPWETGNARPVMVGSTSPWSPRPYSSKVYKSIGLEGVQPEAANDYDATAYGLPLTPMEYRTYFEVRYRYLSWNLLLSKIKEWDFILHGRAKISSLKLSTFWIHSIHMGKYSPNLPCMCIYFLVPSRSFGK